MHQRFVHARDDKLAHFVWSLAARARRSCPTRASPRPLVVAWPGDRPLATHPGEVCAKVRATWTRGKFPCPSVWDVRFTLTYRGPLPSAGDRAKKHAIRVDFHPQLKELWRVHPALSHLQNLVDPADSTDEGGAQVTEVGGKKYATLVHPYLSLHAELDVLVLRAGEPGSVIAPHSGDLDNQLKTLFDALRRPSTAAEVPPSWTPSLEEQPFHCLLDDDKYVTRVNVEVDRLLRVPKSPQAYAEVEVRVLLKAVRSTWGNIGLVG